MDEIPNQTPPSYTPPSTSPMPPSSSPKDKEGEWKNILTIIFLVVAPIIGLILVWALATWSKRTKTIVTIVVSIPIVLAIIGIFVAMSLVSSSNVSQSQRIAVDSKITGDITQLRTVAEMIDADDNSYSAFCDTNHTLNVANTHYPQIKWTEDDIISQFPKGTRPADVITCYANNDKYCVSAKLLSGKYYCVDSTGATSPSEGQTSVGCNHINYSCTP